ncbi:MAG: hypothetical protein N2Z72_05175 [Bacteroidales bacterium]|nr:hypothetical protein [Bacteroidales bacterium]
MKKIGVLFFLVVLVLMGQSSYEEIVDRFFQIYSKEAPEKALDYVFSTNPYMDVQSEQVKNIKMRLGTVTALIGDFYGYEKMIVHEYAPSLVSVTYLVKHKRQPLYYTFVFYKPEKNWQILNIRFDDKLENVPWNKESYGK